MSCGRCEDRLCTLWMVLVGSAWETSLFAYPISAWGILFISVFYSLQMSTLACPLISFKTWIWMSIYVLMSSWSPRSGLLSGQLDNERQHWLWWHYKFDIQKCRLCHPTVSSLRDLLNVSIENGLPIRLGSPTRVFSNLSYLDGQDALCKNRLSPCQAVITSRPWSWAGLGNLG